MREKWLKSATAVKQNKDNVRKTIELLWLW
jgi:hypothetical protein